ncbi:Hsp20/alpha crystallin family protein [Pseudorhizobium flavum]|uniref:HSP20 family molecular chaperone IbpA n=1 Tax=Pseudorhizobium flavum TaxID=1335061 RepID=A0A7W9Z1F2_9HYPH|nr:Hsp20 family protein [Pseudorhizobium flavum]MBB6182265.1 HSP20 family molecular chaperone IbpA [Pseudorhizobium flavum]
MTARLGYEGILSRGLSRMWRRPNRSPDLSDEATANFSVSETFEKVTVVFEVPGRGLDELLLDATSLSVRLRAQELAIEGRMGGGVDQLVPLPEAVEPERVTANLQDGLLTVDLPKAAWVHGKARRVPVGPGPSVATPHHKDQPDTHA